MQIDLTVGEITKLVEGQTSLDSSFLIENIKSFETAKQSDIAFFIDRGEGSVFDKLPLEQIQKSNAGLILSSRPIIEGKNYLIVKDPLGAFQKIVDYVQNRKFVTGIHNSARIGVTAKLEENVIVRENVVIEDGSFIGKNSYIGSNVYVGKNVCIGKNVRLNPGCRILHDCVIGDNTQIHSNAVIGSDGFGYEVGPAGLRKIPQIGIVRIGQNVEIGANATIDRAAFDETFIGDGVKIDNMVHIAHNVYIGSHTAILAQTAIAGSVKIGFGCQIGGQVAIKDHVIIGSGAKIVSKSAVMKDVTDGETVAGIPAMPFSKWKRLMVATMRLPEIIDIAKQAKKFLDKKNEKKSFWMKFFK